MVLSVNFFKNTVGKEKVRQKKKMKIFNLGNEIFWPQLESSLRMNYSTKSDTIAIIYICAEEDKRYNILPSITLKFHFRFPSAMYCNYTREIEAKHKQLKKLMKTGIQNDDWYLNY